LPEAGETAVVERAGGVKEDEIFEKEKEGDEGEEEVREDEDEVCFDA